MIRIAVHDFGLWLNHPVVGGCCSAGAWFGKSIRIPVPFTGGVSGYHGTACAALIVGRGVIPGIAPEVSIIPVGIAPTHEPGTLTASLCWAAQNADIVLTAWTTADWLADQAQIDHGFDEGRGGLGTLWIGAVGNAGTSSVAFPARVSRCIGVGSFTSDQQIASYCNHGPGLDLLAPGCGGSVSVQSIPRQPSRTVPAEPFPGTSASAALVAAVAAHVLMAHPDWRESQARQYLCESLAIRHPNSPVRVLQHERLPW